MAFHLGTDNRGVAGGIRRIATEQVDRAVAEIESDELDRHAKVHQVRKRCKKLRAALRLVRPAMPAYAEENAFFRDTARPLSDIRDAKVLIRTLQSLTSRLEERVERQPLVAAWRARLDDDAAADAALATARGRLEEARRRVRSWEIDEEGFAACARGLRKTYARARHAMADALNLATPEAFHDWRKRVKYHGHHTRLLEPIWPDGIGAHRALAEDLSDLLGEEHDLSVLKVVIETAPESSVQPACGRNELLARIERRRGSLRRTARGAGRRLLAEKPKRLLARWEAYWGAWRDERRAADRRAPLKVAA